MSNKIFSLEREALTVAVSRKHQIDADVQAALQAQSYESLAIKRSRECCYLVVTVAGHAHVLGTGEGRALTFRHAWQIREWLASQFQIAADSIPVEIYR